MKNHVKFLTVGLVAFAFGLTLANYAVSASPSNYKVAVVDVQRIVRGSSQVMQLNQERQAKNEELGKFLETAKNDITKEKDAKKKKALEEKYDREFQEKRAEAAKDYETKLLEIDKSMTAIIKAKAKADGYNLVLAKDAVLTGGVDITDAIASQVK